MMNEIKRLKPVLVLGLVVVDQMLQQIGSFLCLYLVNLYKVLYNTHTVNHRVTSKAQIPFCATRHDTTCYLDHAFLVQMFATTFHFPLLTSLVPP